MSPVWGFESFSVCIHSCSNICSNVGLSDGLKLRHHLTSCWHSAEDQGGNSKRYYIFKMNQEMWFCYMVWQVKWCAYQGRLSFWRRDDISKSHRHAQMVCLHKPDHTAAHQVTTPLQSVHGTCGSESILVGCRLLYLQLKKKKIKYFTDCNQLYTDKNLLQNLFSYCHSPNTLLHDLYVSL